MKMTVTRGHVADALRGHFTRWACDTIYDHLTELEECTGEELDFDPVAIRCGYIESTLNDVALDYGVDEEGALGFLMRRTTVLAYVDPSVVYAEF